MLDYKQVNPDENIQYNFAYLIDTSDSVGTNTLEQAKHAYISLTNSLIEAGIADVSRFAIIPFSSDASVQTPQNATEVISTIEGLSGNGFTNFNAALETGYKYFSSLPPGAENIAYFISDGYSTVGGSFEDSAKALQEVANVQAYGFGPANVQELRIIDSERPEIFPDSSQLITRLSANVGALVSSNPDIIDSNNDIEIASAPSDATNQPVEGSSSNNGGQEVLEKEEENLVDDYGEETPSQLPEPQSQSTSPELEIDDVANLGANLDPLTDAVLPVIDIEDVSIEEGNLGSSIAQFTVNLSSPATEEIQFSYETIDGSATSGSDYNQTSGQITIPIGETSAKIDIEVNGDSEVEPNEEFTLKLNELSSATFANEQTEYSKVGVIENDDVVQSSTIIPQNEAPITQTANNKILFDGNLLNLESYAGEIEIELNVSGEALYDNTVGFYEVDNAQGTITDPITGNQLNPSDGQAYIELAIKLREPGLNLNLDGQSSTTVKATLSGGQYGLFLVADGDLSSLEEDFTQVYSSFSEANSDKFQHIRSLGDNTLGIEDLFNGGDNDFNDMVIQFEITEV